MFESFGVINYFTYVLGTIFIILLPGPNSLYVLTLSAQQGYARGWAAALGIFVGDLTLMLATIAGAAAVIKAYPSIFDVLRLVGAMYLAFIGLQLIYGAYQTWREDRTVPLQDYRILKPTSAYRAFRKALLISLLNPKAILFFLSFFLQFVDPAYSQKLVPFIILIITLQVLSMSYLWLLIIAGSRLAECFRKLPRTRAVSSMGVGGGFIGFAIKLAFAAV